MSDAWASRVEEAALDRCYGEAAIIVMPLCPSSCTGGGGLLYPLLSADES